MGNMQQAPRRTELLQTCWESAKASFTESGGDTLGLDTVKFFPSSVSITLLEYEETTGEVDGSQDYKTGFKVSFGDTERVRPSVEGAAIFREDYEIQEYEVARSDDERLNGITEYLLVAIASTLVDEHELGISQWNALPE